MLQLIEMEAQRASSGSESEESDGEYDDSFVNDQTILSQQLSQGTLSLYIYTDDNPTMQFQTEIPWNYSVKTTCFYQLSVREIQNNALWDIL